MKRRATQCVVLLAAIAFAWGQTAQGEIKNVILMIADGAGFNTWDATSMYQGKWDADAGHSVQVYDGTKWIRLAVATYPLTTSKSPTGQTDQDQAVVYDPDDAWNTATGFKWLMVGYTDSAAAATALSTGTKTYNNAINWSNTDQPLGPTLVELAKSAGKSTGVVTSVQWSHATPAALGGAKCEDRGNYAEIARQLIENGDLDVIMGAGNPDFDDDGRPAEGKKEFKYVGGEKIWQAIEAARQTACETYKGFRPVSSRAEFEALLSGPVPSKVLGTAQVARTLQVYRSGMEPDDPPYDDPNIASVPTLANMTRGAIRVLEQNPRGMFLMVEGGAIDWANHKRNPGRMIEEQADFNRTVQAVVDWIGNHGDWSDTLLILTADHETGLLWGPDSEMVAFDPIVDHGIGRMPGLHYNSNNHTNSLVPVYARGDQSSSLVDAATGSDPVRGRYLDNTSIFQAIADAIGAAKPEPAAAGSP